MQKLSERQLKDIIRDLEKDLNEHKRGKTSYMACVKSANKHKSPAEYKRVCKAYSDMYDKTTVGLVKAIASYKKQLKSLKK